MISEFNGLRECLITKEMVLEFHKDFPASSATDRLQVLSDEFKHGMHYLTGKFTETLYCLPMLTNGEMLNLKSRNIKQKEKFFQSFARISDQADVKESVMKKSEYSSKYALCIYKYTSYDFRDLRRCTKFECRHKLETNLRPKDITPSDHIRNILTSSFSLQNSI